MAVRASEGALEAPSALPAAELEVHDLTRRFGGLWALDGISLSATRDELLGIIGPNGAGKTTLFNVISGMLPPTSGRVLFRGQDITGLLPFRITRLGIGRKFQVPNVFESLTVRQNLVVASRGKWDLARLLKSRRETGSNADPILELLQLDTKADREASALSHGEKQWLEIGMLLANEPKLLLLDEPTAGMTIRETKRTEEMLRELALGHTIVVIEHDIKFIRGVAERVVVLHRGKVLTAGSIDEVEADPTVRDVYLGRSE